MCAKARRGAAVDPVSTCVLVPKLLLGNAVMEALASRLAKLELRHCVPKQELGNERTSENNINLTKPNS